MCANVWKQSGYPPSTLAQWEEQRLEVPAYHFVGPLTSPLGAGLTGPLRYVLAPFGYNDTIPDGYNHTAVMNSNTVPRCTTFRQLSPLLLTAFQTATSLQDRLCPVSPCLLGQLHQLHSEPSSPPATTFTAVSLMDWRMKMLRELDLHCGHRSLEQEVLNLT